MPLVLSLDSCILHGRQVLSDLAAATAQTEGGAAKRTIRLWGTGSQVIQRVMDFIKRCGGGMRLSLHDPPGSVCGDETAAPPADDLTRTCSH